MKNTLQNNTQSDNISEEINNMFLKLQVDESENITLSYFHY